MLSKTLLFFLVVYFVSEFANGQKDKRFFRKDYTYLKETEGFYKIHTIPKTWNDAKRMCELEGASLYYPENDKEVHAVLSFYGNSTQQSIEFVLVGISDLIAEGLFKTIDGNPVSDVYNNWYPGEPNNLGGVEHCVNLKADGTLNDCPCDTNSIFICKKKLSSLEWNQKCNIPNLDYNYDKDTGNCYKFHRSPLTWSEAYAVCAAEQSHLAVIDSQLEADYLVKLTEAAPSDRVRGNYLRGIYHLGFHNKFNEGWRTVTGTSLKEGYYTWWGNYQPDGDKHEQCGSMFYNGHLTHIDCGTRCFFICEHEVGNSPSAKEVEDHTLGIVKDHTQGYYWTWAP